MAEVLEQLSSMTRAQLREMRARADLLLKAAESRSGTTGRERREVRLHSAIEAETASLQIRIPPLGVIVKGDLRKSFVEASQIVDDYISQVWGKTREQKRLKMTRLFVRMAIEQITEGRAPLSLRTILQTLVKTPSLVERSFPGYMESGLLHILLERV